MILGYLNSFCQIDAMEELNHILGCVTINSTFSLKMYEFAK